jgi:hypothetical protein
MLTTWLSGSIDGSKNLFFVFYALSFEKVLLKAKHFILCKISVWA